MSEQENNNKGNPFFYIITIFLLIVACFLFLGIIVQQAEKDYHEEERYIQSINEKLVSKYVKENLNECELFRYCLNTTKSVKLDEPLIGFCDRKAEAITEQDRNTTKKIIKKTNQLNTMEEQENGK